MIYTLPLRLTILHLAQRFRIDGETFISTFLLANDHSSQNSQEFDYILSFNFRPDYTLFSHGSWDSQEKRFSFGDSN
jgi:hypothetical protein